METHSTQKRLNVYCQCMIVLLTLITVRLWMMPVEMMPQAQAQFMDPGAQRVKLLKATERTNALLTEIHGTLKGTLNVKIEGENNGSKKTKSGGRKSKP
ncbi:MAG: hypothetical protein IID41_07635 [Planctomycetes bacterium]|nr:hypothetical protein [Planctomycetota bacterium]